MLPLDFRILPAQLRLQSVRAVLGVPWAKAISFSRDASRARACCDEEGM
jgi:hypothetical protein